MVSHTLLHEHLSTNKPTPVHLCLCPPIQQPHISIFSRTSINPRSLRPTRSPLRLSRQFFTLAVQSSRLFHRFSLSIFRIALINNNYQLREQGHPRWGQVVWRRVLLRVISHLSLTPSLHGNLTSPSDLCKSRALAHREKNGHMCAYFCSVCAVLASNNLFSLMTRTN